MAHGYLTEELYPMRKNQENKIQKRSGNSKKAEAVITNQKLHHLAFDNSAQANIIFTVSNEKVLKANRAACKLLGYSKKELLTKYRPAIFIITASSFKNILKHSMAEGQSIAMVTALKKSGKPFPCEVTSAIFLDEDGSKKAIATIADMSQSILKQKRIDTIKEKIVADNIILAKSIQKRIDVRKEKIVDDNIILAKAKSDDRLTKNNEWIKYIAKTSYDVMWDWDIITGKIYVGDSIEEVFGYKVQNNRVRFTDFTSCLLPDEKILVEKRLFETLTSSKKNWNDSYMFKRSDGSVANTTSRASIVRDDKGNATRLIGAIQDVSRVQELEKTLEEQIIIRDSEIEKLQVKKEMSIERQEPELMDDKKSILIEKIKNVIEELIYYSQAQLKTNFSDHLSKKLQYDYTYLANIFSEVEGMTIRHFIISHKIELVKELIVQNELNLTEIALKLHYSSVAHLSNQFKKATGFTPSTFKQLNIKRQNVLEKV